MARTTRKKSAAAPVAEISTGRYIPTEDRKGGPFDDYEVREALSTLSKAIKIKKNPSLMRVIRAEARRQLAAAESTKKALSGE